MPELDEFGIPIRKTVQPTQELDDFGIPIKKKESSSSPFLVTKSPSNLREANIPSGQPFLGNTLQEAVAKDKTPKTNWAAAKYNDLVGVLSSTLGGLASLQEKRYNVGLERAMELSGETEQRKAMMREKAFIKGSGEQVKQSVEKLRSKASDKEYEEELNKFDISDGIEMSDLGGILNSAPAQIANMIAAVPTYGANYYLQAVDDAISEIEKSPNADKVSESDKLLYANTQGLVQAALEYLPISAMLSKTGLGSTVKNAITKTVLNNFVKKGVKATAKELEEAVTKEVSSFSKKAMRVGSDAAFGILAESPTEGLQQGASDGIKLAVNAMKNNQIFDERDIKKNFWKNIGNATVAGGAFGGIFGGGAGVMKNTNKAIRSEIAKAENQQDLQKIQNDLNYQVELGNLTQEEAKAAGITAQQYAEIASKIPAEIPKDKKYAIIGGIEQREKLKQDIELVKADEKSIDDAFPEYKQGKKDEIALLEGKLGQVNDYIESTVSDKEPKYIQKEGKFFKEVDGKQIEIPKQHYEAGKLVEIGKKQNEVTYEGQKWSIKEDLGDTVVITKPNGSEIQVNKSELENINKEGKIQQPAETKTPTASDVEKTKEEKNVRDLNILGADIGFDKPYRKNYEEGEQGDLDYVNDNIKHNEKVDKTILGLNQEGTLTDNEGREYLVTITSQGVRVINKLSDGTEGNDIYYRNGKRVGAQTPFTKGFSFKPKSESLLSKEQPIPTQEVKPTEVKEEIKLSPIEFSKTIEDKYGITVDLTGNVEKGDLTLSKIEVPKDKQESGIGSRAMEDIIKYADENNKRIVLTPSTDFGATSVGRLKDFYKQFGFVENKGSNKDFTTKETMYRQPKEQPKAETKTIEQLRAEEKAEYAAMTDPKDEVKREEIYNKYDKLITPLLEKEQQKQTPKIKENAVQVESTSSVLQPEQEKIGETRGERGGVEQGEQGEEVAPKVISEGEAKVYEEKVEPKKKEYISKNGKHKIVYDEDGKYTVIEVKSGEEASPYMTKKIINEAADNYDFSKGKRAEFEEGLQLKDEKEADEYALENTNNPIEVAEIYSRQKPEGQPLSTVEQMIAEMGIGKVTPESFKRYGDKNNIDSSIVFAYFKGKRGQKARPIDVIAKEMSDHYGVEIEPQDIVDFMTRFPKGEASALKQSENIVAATAREKFEKLTGLPLTQEIAAKAIDYEFNKLSKEQQQLAEQQFRDEKELTDAYWKEQNRINNAGKESDNIKVEPTKEQTKVEPKKEDLGSKARSLAEQLRKGDKSVLPDWLKADLPKGTKLQGVDINEAFAKALETFADVYDKAKDFAKAVEEGFKYIKDYFDENNIDYNEAELKEKFASQFKEQKELDEQRRFTARMLATEGLLPISEIAKTLDYVKQKNEMSINEANDIIKKVGLDEAFNLVKDSRDMNGGVRSVLGQSLISRYNNLAKIATEQAEKEFYWDKTIEVANYVTEKLATDAGQQIQAFSLWGKLSPEAQLRNAQKDMQKQGEFSKKKAKKYSDAIAKKLIKANEEAVSEVLESKEFQEEIGKTENKQKSNAADKIKKAQAKRKAIIDKYKNNRGGITLSSGGLTTEGIEFVGEVAKTYIEEGIATVELIVEKIIEDFKTISGKDADKDIIKQIKDITDKKISSSDSKLLSKGMANMKMKISEIVKQHYTKVDYAKKKLSDKLVEEAGLEGEEAVALAEKISAAFDRVANKKKIQILEQETKRLEKAKEKLKGTKQPTIKQLHEAIIKYTNLGGFGNEELLDLLAEKVGTGKLTLEEGKKLQELAEKVRVAADGSPKNDAIQELLNYQANLKGVQAGELSQAVWYASLLAGYKTQIKNIVANAVNTFSETFVKSIQNPLASPFLIKGLFSGYKRGLIEALYTLRTGKSPIYISKIEASNVLERKSFKGGIYNPFNYLKYVNRAMAAADVFAFQGLKESRSYQLAYSEAARLGGKNLMQKEYWNIRNPFDKKVWEKVNSKLFNTKQRYEDAMQIVDFEGLKGIEAKRRIFEIMEQSRDFKMVDDAYNYAARGTFNYNPEGILGALNNRLAVLLDTQFGSTKPIRYIVPFTRILTNVANQALNYEPITGTRRAIRGKVGLESFKGTSITKDAYREMTYEERKDQITRAAIGISTMAILYALSKSKDDNDEPLLEITGGGSIDFNKTNQLKERGWQPYSIKIGDTYYSYKLTPLILSLGYIGNLNDYEKYDSKGKTDMIDKMSQTAFRTSDALADMTWVSSTADFMSDFFKQGDASKGKKVQQWLENQAKTAIPFMQPYTQIAQGVEDLMNIPQKETSQLGASFVKDIPIARNYLYNKINVLGEEISKDNSLLFTKRKHDKVWDYLQDNNVFVSPIKRQSVIIWDDKEKIERPLTMQEFYDYSKLRGQLIKKGIEQLMEDGIVEIDLVKGTKTTRKAKKEEIESEVKSIVKDKTEEAKSTLFKEKPLEIPKKITFPASLLKPKTGGSY